MTKLYLQQTDNFLPTGYQTITTFCLTLSIAFGKKLQRNLMKPLCHGSIKSIVYLYSSYDLYRKRHLMNELLCNRLIVHINSLAVKFKLGHKSRHRSKMPTIRQITRNLLQVNSQTQRLFSYHDGFIL